MAALAQTAAGQIKVAKVDKEVLKQVAGGAPVALKDGDVLTESDVVTTGKDASVVLVFMNGSSVKLGSESRLAIDEFKMDPLADEINLSTLKAEPSVSKTSLNLAYGEMVGDVKKLNSSSSYSIKTPVGAAGIRGTIFRIVFRPSADGKAFFTVSTLEGLVVMQGVVAAEIPVSVDKEVTVEIDVPDTPGETPAAPVISTQDIPPATKNIITSATLVISDAVSSTPINTTGTPTTTTTTTTAKTDTPPTDTSKPPETVKVTVTLTPGAGK